MRLDSGVIDTKFTPARRSGFFGEAPLQITVLAFAACALAMGLALCGERPSPDVSAAIAAAVADSSRPDSDTARDADRNRRKRWLQRHQAGDRSPTMSRIRLFHASVRERRRPQGHVYAVSRPHSSSSRASPAVAELQGYAVAHPNVTSRLPRRWKD